MLGSKEIDTISNSDIYDTYKDLYLRKKRTRRKAASRYTVSQWLKGTYRCKKYGCHGTGSGNPGKCDQKDAW